MITVKRRAHLGVGDGVGLSECFKNLLPVMISMLFFVDEICPLILLDLFHKSAILYILK